MMIIYAQIDLLFDHVLVFLIFFHRIITYIILMYMDKIYFRSFIVNSYIVIWEKIENS